MILSRILQGMLWLTLVLSSGFLAMSPFEHQAALKQEDADEAVGFSSPRGREIASFYTMARITNPYGQAPTVFTLSAGFLAILTSKTRKNEK
ncbi:MAG: hypothetical protein ACLQGP_29515 [Isosphaeraceae bacterium]